MENKVIQSYQLQQTGMSRPDHKFNSSVNLDLLDYSNHEYRN